MIESFFKGDTYDTPKESKRIIWDKLFLNARWYFVYGYAKVIAKSRKIALAGKYDRYQWAKSSYETLDLVQRCGGEFHIKGIENLKLCKGPVVFISNHMSTLETFILPCIIAPIMEVTFVVKESLVKHKFFGPVMRARNPIVVKRVNPREDFQEVMTKGKEFLANGTSVIIFPQSTRSEVFEPEQFNTMGVKLAKDAGVQVVPIAVKTNFWGNGKFLKDVGPINRNNPVYITIEKPISIEGNGKEEHKKIIEFIKNRLKEWGGKIKE